VDRNRRGLERGQPRDHHGDPGRRHGSRPAAWRLRAHRGSGQCRPGRRRAEGDAMVRRHRPGPHHARRQ
jgi:hypothetical protein